jgi:hypothetical protein
MYPPPLFKLRDDADDAKPRSRPQEDLEDLVLDETRPSGEHLDRQEGAAHGSATPKGD